MDGQVVHGRERSVHGHGMGEAGVCVDVAGCLKLNVECPVIEVLWELLCDIMN